jgi:hypothetical protein
MNLNRNVADLCQKIRHNDRLSRAGHSEQDAVLRYELRTGVFKDLERIKWYRLSGSGPRRRVLSHSSGVLPGVRPASRFIWRTTDGSNTPSKWAGHESPRTTKLYDRTKDEITLSEVERIRL